jgi:hypothetical protein
VSLDREGYRREVLDPARRSGMPPADLFARYGFTGRPPAEAAFRTQVGEVAGLWKTYKSRPGWGTLIEGLLGQHDELKRAGQLTVAAFEARRRKTRAAAEQRLSGLVKGENATHVGPAAVARLRGLAGAGVDDDQVRRVLAAVGIKVVDPLPDLPATPPAGYADLASNVRTLDVRLSAEVVFGADTVRAGFRVLAGFRLADGRRLDGPDLKDATGRSQAMSHSNPRKTPTAKVLTVLNSAIRTGAADRLLLWEVIGPHRSLVAGFTQKVIADQLAESGLNREEAGIIAAAMLEGGAAQGGDDARRRQVEEDLAVGALRSAQLQAAGLPGGDELRARVTARIAEVASLVAAAEAELAAGRTERGARLLADVLIQVTDDAHLAERLASLAPPPASAATAVVDGGQVLVSWQPSAALTGSVRYRVTRGTNRVPGSPGEGFVVADETGDLHAADKAAPPGANLYYAVFAGRGGAGWSPPAGTPRVVFAPEVTDVALEVTADAVSAAWRAPQGATEIMVERVVAGRATAIPSDLTRFSDAGLTPGTEYLYRIAVVYRAADGSACTSARVSLRAMPAPAPVPVESLRVQAKAPAIEVSWVPPPLGRVDLLLSPVRPPWRSGAEPAQAALAAFGRPVAATPRPAADGRVAMLMPAPSSRSYLLAVTRVGLRAVVGAWTEFGTAQPVSEVTAERRLDDAQFSWIWPKGAVDSIISWPGGERRCTRRQYDDEGGPTIPVGSAEVVVQVRAIHPDPVAELVALAVSVTVAARPAMVQYHWRKSLGRRLLELTTDQACELPELIVVRSTAAYPPDEPSDGVEVIRLPPVSIRPEAPLRIPVRLPRRATGFLACFPASRDHGLLLFPPPHSEMRIR